MQPNPPHDYAYWTDCVNTVGALINEMRDHDLEREVTYETMMSHCEGLLDWSQNNGYELRVTSGSGVTLKHDPYVSYHRSLYCGVPCYYLCWSGIEHIWIKKGYEEEVTACEVEAQVTAPPSTSLLPGGRADLVGLSPADVDQEQLRRGIEVELEHTTDRSIAQEIAMDHLAEDPDYYTKLATIDPHHNPRQSDPREGLLIPDSSWFDPDELWGRLLVKGDPACRLSNLKSNPPPWIPLAPFSVRRAEHARAILESYNIQLSSNIKTLICLSMTRNLSCLMSPWCERFCFGKSQNFCRPATSDVLLKNFDAFEFLATAPQQTVDDVAWAIMTVCLVFGIQNLRVPGIGDFTQGLIRVVDSITAADPAFTIWGFTRRHERSLQEMPVKDNLVVWASIDSSMSDKRLDQAFDFVAAHKTGLSYSTDYGETYKPRDGKDPEPPWWNPPLLPEKKQPESDFDPFLDELIKSHQDDLSVIFGYHGRGKTTHVGYSLPECPATDPLAGAHFIGACQECYWCLEKPSRRHHLDLVEHRLNTVSVIPTPPYLGTRVLLDTGEKV